jgi:hypothetical protein
VYARTVNGKEYSFGVSGLLYKSNVLMYDHQTESLWLQVKRQAVTGPMTGTKLDILPSTLTTWAKWLKKHPRTAVLTTETGHQRDYSRDPYASYYKSRSGFLSFFSLGPGEQEKELVVGVEIGDQTFAFGMNALRRNRTLTASVDGEQLTAHYDADDDSLRVENDKQERVPHVLVYWFVWKGIHPATGRTAVIK